MGCRRRGGGLGFLSGTGEDEVEARWLTPDVDEMLVGVEVDGGRRCWGG